jgi:putative DNA primase/helicase
MAGYSLTGDTSEQALFFGYGEGNNGKGVFVNTLRESMGDYAVSTPAETFLASTVERHPTELARLRGARLVVASEINEGQRWNEARIKNLTGGDPVDARFMRGDFFQYKPQFKLLIIGNHQPALSSVDEAIRRRMNLLPFTVVIPKPLRDKQLSAKLREEQPAILRWAIDGCLEWQRIGLDPPQCVQDATEDYLSGQNLFEQWRSDCCERDITVSTSATALYHSWRDWATIRGEFVGSQKRFSQTLIERGWKRHHGRTGWAFEGWRLRGR